MFKKILLISRLVKAVLKSSRRASLNQSAGEDQTNQSFCPIFIIGSNNKIDVKNQSDEIQSKDKSEALK